MIAIIAGTGTLPLEACDHFLHKEKNFFVISLFEENRQMIQRYVEGKASVVAQPFYKVGGILETLRKKNTKQLLFIGKVDKRNLLKKIKFDLLYFKLAAKILYKNDAAIMELLVETLAKNNIEVLSQDSILEKLFVSPGILTGKLSSKLECDISLGMKTAEAISRSDIGQTVVVKDGMVLAVEAIEGTNKCIQRGITLGKNGVVVCKTAHKNQNKKYDLPTLGPESLQHLKKNEVQVIAWKSSKTFIAEKERFTREAHALGITLVSLE